MTIAALQQLIKDLTFEEPDFCNDDAFLRWIELKGLELSPREFGDAVSAGY